MKLLKVHSKRQSYRFRHPNGFGMSEAVVAAGACILLIGASALALRSTQTLVDRSESKASLRQNTTNGLKLLRSEVERSLHILVHNSEATQDKENRTDLANEQYQATLKKCGSIVHQTKAFRPVFGVKIAEINTPIIYGLSVSSSNNGYALMRCGVPLDLDGRYDDDKGINALFLTKAIDDIGSMGCSNPEGDCKHPTNSKGDIKGLNEIIKDLDVNFTEDKTPIRTFKQPALRVETDSTRKLVKFIDPNPNNDPKLFEATSYLETKSDSRTITQYPLYLAAFARADKRIEQYGNQPHYHFPSRGNLGGFDPRCRDGICLDSRKNAISIKCHKDHCHPNVTSDHSHGEVINTTYFLNVRSKRIRFLVDGSGSMSACILWGSKGYPGKYRWYWFPVGVDGLGRYKPTRRHCALTRMESLQIELTNLLTALPSDTKISIQSFSSEGYRNHKVWNKSRDGLVMIGNNGVLESAMIFVNSLDNGDPRRWGGTYPWNGLDVSFQDNETDTLYFLTDGRPNRNRNGNWWKDNDYDHTINHYLDSNKRRKQILKTNTISIGLSSPWMEELSINTYGNYHQIDKSFAGTYR